MSKSWTDWVPLHKNEWGVEYYIRFCEDGCSEVMGLQDVSAILDRNQAMANHNDGYSESRELRRVGSIPVKLAEKLSQEKGVDIFSEEGAPVLARIFNDSDYSKLRTAPGRVGVSNGVLR